MHPFWCTHWHWALVSCEKCGVFHHCAPILGRGIIYHWSQTNFFFFFTLATMTFIGSDSKKLIHCMALHCNLQPAHSIPRFRFQLSPAASTFSWQLFWMLHPKNAPDVKSAVATHGLEHVSENFTHHIVVTLAYLTSNGNLSFMRGMILLPFWCILPQSWFFNVILNILLFGPWGCPFGSNPSLHRCWRERKLLWCT